MSGRVLVKKIGCVSTVQKIDDNQRNSNTIQEKTIFTLNKTSKTVWRSFFTWMIIGALLCGIILAVIVTMYIKQPSEYFHISRQTTYRRCTLES